MSTLRQRIDKAIQLIENADLDAIADKIENHLSDEPDLYEQDDVNDEVIGMLESLLEDA